MKDKGFTLIEMILAIVVSSIVLLGVANFTELGYERLFWFCRAISITN